MKTTHKVKFWCQPYIRENGNPIQEKVYFEGYTSTIDKHIRDNDRLIYIADNNFIPNIIQNVMDQNDWALNNDWGVSSVSYGAFSHPEGYFVSIDSPEAIAKQKRVEKEKKDKALQIVKLDKSIKTLKLTDKQIDFNEKTANLEISIPYLNKPVLVPIEKLYDIIDMDTRNINATLTNSFNEKILSLYHGSFLNARLADINVFKTGTRPEDVQTFLGKAKHQKGGIFIRSDGTLDIGDIERTKWLHVNLVALIKELYTKGFLGETVKYISGVTPLLLGPQNKTNTNK